MWESFTKVVKMKEKNDFFKISSGLKHLLGAGLITDNYTAIFELVKNSFDAHATEVRITFENIYDSEKAAILIQDNGKGMNDYDIRTKWLFVAYSAKADGTEDLESEIDYRSKLETFRHFAGAHGVGRFSCDKLGRYLELTTIKNENNAIVEKLHVDWKEFDKNLKSEFITIPVKRFIGEREDHPFECGTSLRITGIDISSWSRNTFITLKQRLAKLIRPDLNKSNNDVNFKIILSVSDELDNDLQEYKKGQKDNSYLTDSRIVNGPINNFVFEKLDIKTVKIRSEISSDGETLTTILNDRGTSIYKIVEKNPYNLLKNVSITLYFLNFSAKLIFKKLVGVRTVEYGNIFVYKNGFRIYPYGERGDDSMRIDNRAVQGFNRYIGLRNLIGQIDIQGPNENLMEVTSRNGGLNKNDTYYELVGTATYGDSLLLNTLRRLEKYVVDVTNWGINEDSYNILNDEEGKPKFIKILTNTLQSSNIIDIEFNNDIIDIINSKSAGSASKLIEKVHAIGIASKNEHLVKEIKILQSRFSDLIGAKDSAEKEACSAKQETRKLKKQLDQTTTENLFLRNDVDSDKEVIISLQHHIKRNSDIIANAADSLSAALFSHPEFKYLIDDFINPIIFENKKIQTLSQIVAKAKFNTKSLKIKKNILEFIKEYISNVKPNLWRRNSDEKSCKIHYKDFSSYFNFKFDPIKIIIVIDNLLDNSQKAGAKNINIFWTKKTDTVINLHILDDGYGIPEKIVNRIFDYRFSTTPDGSGIGLFHVRSILHEMGADIILNEQYIKGAEFIIKFTR